MTRVIRSYVSELGQLSAMRAFIVAECRRAWGPAADEETLNELQLAVQEAATNIVRHGYRDEGRRPIQLVLEADPAQVVLTFLYPGREFDPGAVPPPAFDGSREGGFGVFLIRQLVDEVVYDSDTNGLCRIRLLKKRPTHPV